MYRFVSRKTVNNFMFLYIPSTLEICDGRRMISPALCRLLSIRGKSSLLISLLFKIYKQADDFPNLSAVDCAINLL